MVKHLYSQHKGCQFYFSVCHNESAIGKEGNKEPPNKDHFPRKKFRDLSVVSATLEIEYATQSMAMYVCVYAGLGIVAS